MHRMCLSEFRVLKLSTRNENSTLVVCSKIYLAKIWNFAIYNFAGNTGKVFCAFYNKLWIIPQIEFYLFFQFTIIQTFAWQT